MPPASASTSSAARSSASRPSRPHAEQRHHAPERRAGAHRAEQVLAVRDGVPADHDLVVDRLHDALAVERRDGAHERLGRAPRVEHLALADRARADRGAQVVVAADREHGAARRAAARRRPCPSGVPANAGSGSRPAGAPDHASVSSHQPREWRSSQPVREASESSAPCSPPRPCTTHSPTLSQRTPRAVSSTLSRSQRYFATVRSAREESPVVAAEGPGSPSSSRAASSSPRESCQAIDGDHRLAVAVEQHAGLGHARHADARRPGPSGAAASASCAAASAHSTNPCGVDLRARRHRVQSQRRLAVRDLLALGGHDGRLARRRAEVEPQQQLRGSRGSNASRGAPVGAPRPSALSRTACRARPGSRTGCPW